MSETPTAEAEPNPTFTREQVEEFEADDAQAAEAIGKMLAVFFLYTAIVMSLAAWWTFSSIAPGN